MPGVAQSDVAWSEATGRHTAAFVVANDSRDACTLRGYPTIALLGAGGRTLPFSYGHRGDQMIPATRRGPCASVPADASERVRLARYPIVDFCAERASLTIAVSPVVARLEDAAARR